MSKKGFVFVETIVTLTVLIALLIAMYTVFVNLLKKEQVVAEYDKCADYYALFYIKEIWKDNPRYVEGSTYKASSARYNISHPGWHTDIKHFNLNDFVVLKCNNGSVITSFDGVRYNRSDYTSVCSPEFLDYVDSISTCPNDSDFILFAEFKTGNTYTYAHLYYPNYNQ